MSEQKSRREFIRQTGAATLAAGGLLAGQRAAAQEGGSATSSRAAGEIPRRQLGRTGVEVSIIRIRGAHRFVILNRHSTVAE